MSEHTQSHHEPGHDIEQHTHHHDEDTHGHAHPAHAHTPRSGAIGLLLDAVAHVFGLHQHDEVRTFDSVLESSAHGIWALKVSLLALLATAIFQVVIVAMSGSVALLADTIHNFSDALTAIPLWMAFALNRRKPNQRYTYGYGRAEDLAGVLIVLMILASALVVFYESVQKILYPQPLSNLEWVAVAAVIGFIGNEAVAAFRLRVGREIGSAALVADGMHARVDGITSLGVFVGVVGVWLGWSWADPLMGFIIGFAILVIVRDAAREMWHRLMDATDPDIVQRIEHTSSHVQGVQSVHDVRARWVGHRLHSEIHVEIDGDLTVAQSHKIAEEVRHALFHELPALSQVVVHINPCGHDQEDHHAITAHHQNH